MRATRPRGACWWAGLAVIAVASCSRSSPEPLKHERVAVPNKGTNVARADYIGPRACGDCHGDEYARWSQSLHRVMNAKAEDVGAVIGDFTNVVVPYDGGEARFSRDGAAYVMELRKGERHVRYHVTRTIGRRGLQEYVGVEEGRPEEVRLPFGWWPARSGWYPQPYFDPWLGDEATFDAYAPVREPWAGRCPWCHSTYPFELRIARANATHLGHGLEQLFTQPGGGGTSGRLAVEQQVTTGISCESCHLGGRDHAAGAPIHFMPQGLARTTPGSRGLGSEAGQQSRVLVPDAEGSDAYPRPAKFADERRDAAIVNTVCAQCHSGPSPRLADGTALRNSSEALDLAASPCTGIKCTDCHDPHRADARADDRRAIAACTGCHPALADPTAALAHAGKGHAEPLPRAGHGPAAAKPVSGAASAPSTEVSCLDCHMPRIVMGIDRYVRTHRIASPTNPKLLSSAAPNACNLCHLDRSLDWTLDGLRDQWDVRLQVSDQAYDDRNVGDVWLASTVPAIRLLAMHAYARSPLGKGALPELVRGLADPLAYVRTWSQFAIEDVIGRRLRADEYDARAPRDLRAAQLARLRLR